MSSMQNHNDDIFRSSLESYREMPSDKVWAGVESALNQEKKKKRFILWWWTGGIGFAAVAVLIVGLFILKNEKTSVNTYANSTPTKIENTTENENVIAKNNDANKPENLSIASTTPTEKQTVVDSKQNKTTNNTTHSTHQTQKNRTKTSSAHKAVTSKSDNKQVAVNTINNSENKSVKAETRVENKQAEISQRDMLSTIEFTEDISDPDYVQFNPLPAICPVKPNTRITPFISVHGYSGAVGYHREYKETVPSPNNLGQDTSSSSPTRFGFYAATAIKGGFMLNNRFYFSASVGYETQRFTSRESFHIPGSLSSNPSDVNNNYTNTNASFGNVSLPLEMEDAQFLGQTLNGKLVYQNHHLFFPIDVGYKFSYKKLGINLGLVSAFHVPIHQKAIFYSDSGEERVVNVNKAAVFNFSLGFEPSLEYRFARQVSLIAGGTFRYSLLNAFQGTANISRPYVLGGNLGFRFYLK